MRMPFGKYRNWEVKDVPEDYLVWAHANLRDISPWLRSEIAFVLDALQQERTERFKAERREVSTDIVGAWYRQMAREFHPDHRGNHEGMKAVNRGRELLLELTTAGAR